MLKELNYHRLYRSGELERRIKELEERLRECTLCPRQCKINRLEGKRGYCRAGKLPTISSYGPHFGEEPELVGRYGSGTIFMTYCNLGCIFCQNYEISHLGSGDEVSLEEFARMMLDLQKMGCHNINIVTPTHFVPQMVAALALATEKGLHIPLVYNSGGYDSLETIKLLEGIVDIYMPDAKYAEGAIAKQYSNAPDYPEVVKTVLKEMYRQVGDLVTDEDGIAVKGLLVRHLVLPHRLAGTKEILHFIATEISTNTYVNIMDQYRPMYRASEFPLLQRRITTEEYFEAVRIAKEEGLHRGFSTRPRFLIF